MTLSLQTGKDAYLQANPSSSIHRFCGLVHPDRARSDERLEMLSVARRLVHLQTQWDRQFLKSPFFARFGTRCRPTGEVTYEDREAYF